jgi:5-methylcytosine-specific restriction endonuclease McrA
MSWKIVGTTPRENTVRFSSREYLTMGEAAKRWAKAQEEIRKSDRPQEDELRPEEQKALDTIQREAKERHSFLTSGGKGGLPPSLVLGVLRRDKYTCKTCGEKGDQDNGGIGIHHKYQHLADSKERKKGMLANKQGRRNDPSQMVTICKRCHDNVHEEDRAENPGEKDADQELRAEQ